LDEIQSRLITTFDEVPPNFRGRIHPDKLPCRSKYRLREISGVDLKRVPPKSRPAARHRNSPPACADGPSRVEQPARTPPSTFLFLPIHLSNSPGSQPHLRTRQSF
jgi:hypothetical protein